MADITSKDAGGGAGAPYGRSMALSMLATLYMLGFTNLFLRNSLNIMAPAIGEDMAISPETLSVVASSFFFAYGLMQIPSGMLLDRFGARVTLSFLLLFTMLGAALFSVAVDASQLIFARILMGIGCAGIFSGAFFVVNAHVAPERVVTQTGLLNSFAAIGGLCATAPLAVLLTYYDWRLCFWVFTGGVGVLLLSVCFGLGEKRGGDEKVPETLLQILGGVRRTIAQPGMKRLLFVGIPLSAQTAVMGVWGAPYLRDVHGLDDIGRGSVMLAMAVSGVFGHSSLGFAARTFKSIRLTIAGAGGIVVGLLVALATMKHPSVITVTLIFTVLGFVTMYPMLAFAHARSLVPPELVGRGVAVTNMGIMTAIASSQLLFGWVLGLFPLETGTPPETAYRTAFGVLAGLAAIAILFYLPAREAAADYHKS